MSLQPASNLENSSAGLAAVNELALDRNQLEINSALEAAIDPWLQHMRWRSDFVQWREGRLWQEKKQKSTINHLRSFLQLLRADSSGDSLAGRSILDLGSGMGGLTTALSLAGAEVTPVDFNADYCRITRLRGRRYDLNFRAVNAAGEALPFPSAQFDIIVCMDVLEHVQDPEKVMAEISRCLKPGGVCQLTAINRFAFNDPHYHLRFVNWLPRSLAPACIRLTGRTKDNVRFADRQTLNEMHYYRYKQLTDLCARHGLENVVESGEFKLRRRLTGWKGLLQRTGLLGFTYRAYRSVYKSTYVVMAVKSD